MKTILYLDFLSPQGHIEQNSKYINILASTYKITIVNVGISYKIHNRSNIEIVTIPNTKIPKGFIKSRISIYKLILKQLDLINSKKYDSVFISSYETISLFFAQFRIQMKEKCYLLNHVNLDKNKKFVNKIFFTLISKKFNQVVFEDFMKNELVDNYGLNSRKVYVIPHQINNVVVKTNNDFDSYDIIAISNSNDENIVGRLIELEKKYQIFKEMKIKILIKSRIHHYTNGYFLTVNEFLKDEVYDWLYENCAIVYLPFGSNFKFRISGNLVDALSKNKFVIGENIEIIREYSKRYGNSIKIVDGPVAFYRYIIDNIDEIKKKEIKYKDFFLDHSDQNVLKSFISMFKDDDYE